MTQTPALRNCALVSRYFFDGGRETEIVCVKNVILSHVLLGTCFFGIEKQVIQRTPWPFIVINPI